MTDIKSKEELQELLVELAYDEIDPVDATAAGAHLDDDATALLAAFRAVRADLQAYDDVEPAPSRVAFVAMGHPRSAAGAGWSRWTKGLAVAASFVMGFLLTAAVANVRVSSGPDGWSISSGLWQPAPVATTSTTDTQPPVRGAVPVTAVAMSQADLDRWLENKLHERGLSSEGATPVALREEVTPLLDQLIRERETQFRGLVQEIVDAAAREQRQDFDMSLAGMYQAFDAQRANDLMLLAGEFGLLQQNTGEEFQRTNAYIDYLLTRVGSAPQRPEQQDD